MEGFAAPDAFATAGYGAYAPTGCGTAMQKSTRVQDEEKPSVTPEICETHGLKPTEALQTADLRLFCPFSSGQNRTQSTYNEEVRCRYDLRSEL